MSETPTLTVPTAFADISQLAEGMSDRVDEERLMLYGPDAVEDNTWIRFEVLLMDQEVALAGVGRAVASIDGGDERPEVARFDVVLDNLQFEGTSEVVYERMLVYRSQAFTDGPATGEVDQVAVEQAEAALAGEAPADEMFEAEEESTMIAPEEEYSQHVQASMDRQAAAADDAEAVDDAAYADVGDVSDADVADVDADLDVADVPMDFAEEGGEAATVVAVAPSEEELAGPPGEYEEAAPTDIVADEAELSPVDDDGYDDVADAADVSAEAEDFAEVHTADLDAPAEDWQTSEVDIADVAVDEVADVPPSAPPPAPPSAPAGFEIEPVGQNGALTRASRGATWTPDLAEAAPARAPSGLFAYAGTLPVPEHAPRPDLDPSYHIRPAPRPVEEGADATDMNATDGGYEELPEEAAAVVDDGYEAAPEADYADVEADVEAGAEEAPAEDAEIAPVEMGGLDYDDDDGAAEAIGDEDVAMDDADSFLDAPTEVVAEGEAPVYDDADATSFDLESPDEQQ